MRKHKGEANRAANRLILEKSPYLLQHAYNPVDWYPWGPEAFEKARREDKPRALKELLCFWWTPCSSRIWECRKVLIQQKAV